MLAAAEQLSCACTEAASGLTAGEASAREIKELAAAMKELAALRTVLESGAPADTHDTVQVLFDPGAEALSQ